MLDVKPRWNSTSDMLDRFLYLMKPLKLMFKDPNHSYLGDALTPSDWDYLLRLSLILKPFKEVTLIMSRSQVSTLNLTIPLFNMLIDKLDLESKRLESSGVAA